MAARKAAAKQGKKTATVAKTPQRTAAKPAVKKAKAKPKSAVVRAPAKSSSKAAAKPPAARTAKTVAAPRKSTPKSTARKVSVGSPAAPVEKKRAPAKSKAAPASASPPTPVIPPWLVRPRELSVLEAAIKPRREKVPQAPSPSRKPGAAAGRRSKPVAKGRQIPAKAPKKTAPRRAAAPKRTGPAKPKPVRTRGLRKLVKVLKSALKRKKPPGPVIATVLRPDYSEAARTNRDAERLMGVSRQVH